MVEDGTDDHELLWQNLATAWPTLKDERELGRRIRSLGERVIVRAREASQQPGPYHPLLEHNASPHEYRSLCLCFLLYARDSFDAVAQLLATRFLLQSRALLRSFFEAFIELIYISAKPEDRSRQFITFVHAEKKRFQEETSKFPEYPMDPKRQQSVDRQFQSVHHLHAGPSGEPRRTWHGMSFKQLFEQVSDVMPGYKSLWPIFWVALSGYVHPSATAVLQYGHLDPQKGQVRPELAVRVARVDLLTACYFLFGIIWIADRAFALGFDNQLSDWWDRVKSLRSNFGADHGPSACQ